MGLLLQTASIRIPYLRHNDLHVWDVMAIAEYLHEIWRNCLAESGGPFLFGRRMSVADAIYAPVCTRFNTYDVALDPISARYRDHIRGTGDMQRWIHSAKAEPDEVSELEMKVEF